MRADYCPASNEPCQSLCETPCGMSSMAKRIRELEADLSVSEGMYSDLCDRAERLKTHLRQVVEIAKCWMPKYATKADRTELELAEKDAAL